MTKDLVIMGAGGDGKNVAEMVEDIGSEWNLLGFLDDDPSKQGIEINGVPVLGKIVDATKYSNCHYVLLIGHVGNYFAKKRLVAKLGISLGNYATIIHPDARISKYANIGRGSVIYPGVTVMTNAEVGNFVFVAASTDIGHDTKIGDYVTISTLVAVSGYVIIEEGCYIGLSSSIREHVTVREWSTVGMGSVVVSDVPAYHVVVGNPAKVLRKLQPND